ncbi:MAG: Fic family protein [Gemmatimonadetes bacterium]|nr:Fic family protein [Gemmatimonadota bacterium]
MHSLDPVFLDALVLSTEQGATLRGIGEHKGRQTLFERQTPEVLDTLKQAALVESSESSNRIEGIVAPHKRIERIVLRTADPRNRSEQEIAGYRDVLNLIHESTKDIQITTGVIRQFHQVLYRYLPSEGGNWKPTDNEIVEKDASGRVVRVRFQAVSAVETPRAMEEVIHRYDDAVDQDRREPLLIIPLTVLDFLCIHPFTDGNGRIARLLTLLLLYHFEYNVGRYISLERIFEESGQTYYDALEASSQGWHDGNHDAAPWLGYFWGVLLRAYAEFEERVGVVGGGRGSKTQRVRDAVERRVGPFQISDIEMDCPGTSRELIRKVLRALRDEGVIVSEGVGRGARWRRAKK